MLMQDGAGMGALGAGQPGDAGLLWLAPIKVQGCGALATTIIMLTWLTALMKSLQAGCHVASATIIIATGVPALLFFFALLPTAVGTMMTHAGLLSALAGLRSFKDV